MPDYRQVAAQAAKRYGLGDWFVRQIQQESGFDPTARSSAGAQGIAQIVPRWHPDAPPASDPVGQLNWAAKYMAGLVKKYGNAAQALSVYNSGQPDKYKDPNFSGGQTYRYVKNILGGSNPTVPTSGVPTVSVPGTSGFPGASFAGTPDRTITVPRLPDLAQPILANLGSNLPATEQLSQLVGSIASQPLFETKTIPGLPGWNVPGTKGTPATTVAVPGAPGQQFKPTGKPVPGRFLSSVGAEHPTAGLPGYDAYDYMAKAGSPAVAPITGKVIKLSGHDPSGGPTQGVHGPFGWSVYIQGDDGHTYYMTHMGGRNVKVGQKVKAGQQIGTVGNYAKWGGADHIHMGVH